MKTIEIGFFIRAGEEKKPDYHCISACGKYKRHKWKFIHKTIKDAEICPNLFECVQCGIMMIS